MVGDKRGIGEQDRPRCSWVEHIEEAGDEEDQAAGGQKGDVPQRIAPDDHADDDHRSVQQFIDDECAGAIRSDRVAKLDEGDQRQEVDDAALYRTFKREIVGCQESFLHRVIWCAINVMGGCRCADG